MKINPAYSIGIDAIDNQHARWIEIIEHFREIAGQQLMREEAFTAATHALQDLLSYTRHHFAAEERIMADHHYPGLAAHQEKHRELEAAVVRLLDETLDHHSRSTPLKLNLLVTIWMFDHIKHEDQSYADFVLGQTPPFQTRVALQNA